MRVASAIIVALCLADIASTNYVITSGIGYESNEVLAPLIGPNLYALKLVFTIATVLAIARVRMELHLKMACYSTLIAFYTIDVSNNLLVVFQNRDLHLNLGKLLLVFGAIFAVNVLCMHIIRTGNPR